MINANIANDLHGKADIGLIGLAVMGENLVMNMESKASLSLYTTAQWRRWTDLFREGQPGRT